MREPIDTSGALLLKNLFLFFLFPRALEEARTALIALRDSGIAATLGERIPYTWEGVFNKEGGWPGAQRRLAKAQETHWATQTLTLPDWPDWH